jgi:pectin methylesterase-like acyl-CoA thioesterase
LSAPAKSPRVLRVGKNGTYKKIQSAVNAAHPGDWILIAPGDYKERVEIRKDGLHLRDMSRRGVIVDGTKSGPACSSKAKDQVFNRKDEGNGIEFFKANGVWIEKPDRLQLPRRGQPDLVERRRRNPCKGVPANPWC